MSRKFNRRDYKDALGQGLRRIAQPKIHKNTSTARDILLKGARTLVLTYDETELLDATASRDIPRVKQLLEKGTKATCYDERLRTPLHFACAAGCLELINLLITSGAKVNSRDVNGSTPLLLAVTSGNLECVSILLAAGANLEIADARQRTPLSMAKSRLQFLKRQVEFDLPPDYEEVESDKTHLIHQITQQFFHR
ncbi:hypothetical protein K7432_008612 [Basidiobolus ranarum]|uniref:Uncharacterized protein n=1 Tax=Basidiobolus ranarum TaxID=34480 RepID=A0ABR2WRL3_9FUNG